MLIQVPGQRPHSNSVLLGSCFPFFHQEKKKTLFNKSPLLLQKYPRTPSKVTENTEEQLIEANKI